MPISDDELEIRVYRYEVDNRYPEKGVVSVDPIHIERVWFLEYHSLVSNPSILLGNLLNAIRAQSNDLNQQAIRMSAFYKRMLNIVEKSRPL
jgi:hypothetical protein